VDTVPPDAMVADLPAYSPLSVTVAWLGKDTGAGVAAFDVQVCTAPAVTPDCWIDWQVQTVTTTGLFAGVHGQVAAFRARADDAVGNQGAYRPGPDAWTVLDGEGPHTRFAASPGNDPYRLHWEGEDVPAGLAHYDLYFRDEAAGRWEPWLLAVTTTQAVFTGTAGHTYHFCVRGVDRAGNVEDKPCPGGLGTWPPEGEIVLAFSPTSRVEPLPPVAPGSTFAVRWAGTSGMVYDVQVMDVENVGGWEDWLVGTDRTIADFSGVPGHTYAFRCRVRGSDSGTLEPWPWGYDAWTTVPGE
jgi:hypothetical protein